MLKAGASAGSLRDDGSRLAIMMRAVIPNAAQRRIFAAVEPDMPPANGTWMLPRRGKSSIKRPAIALESACVVHCPPGNRAIKEASLRVAVSFGSSESSAASPQGSTFSRASADRTLSSISFLSVPTGA